MLHISYRRSILFLFAICLITSNAAAQSNIVMTQDRGLFEKAGADIAAVDFEAVAPARGFGKYAPGAGLRVGAVSIRASGGGRFGPGQIFTISADYGAPNPMYNTGTGANLTWGPPNQPGNAYLEIALPAGVKVAGADIWAGQPQVSPIEITVSDRDGRSRVFTVTTKKRPDSVFAGFLSETDIAFIRFALPKGQTRLLLDNIRYGKKVENVDLAAMDEAATGVGTAAPGTNGIATIKSELPRQVAETPTATNGRNGEAAVVPASPERASRTGTSAVPAAGRIAYVRGRTEVRMIEPDGSGDKRVWTHPDLTEAIGINEIEWRPNSDELTISSGHEAVASYYHADLYSIRSDGTSLRRITNRPDRDDFPKYKKGTVTVTVRNEQPIYQQANASAGVFFVYVVGADLPQPVTLPPGASRTLVFKDVADFGDHAQAVIAIYGKNRWFIPGTDVRAGATVKAPDFGIRGDGLELFGAFRPIWKPEGSRVSYRSGACVVSSIEANPGVGHSFQPLFKGRNGPSACSWDFGPTPATATQIIYSSGTDSSIYRTTENGPFPGEKLHTFSEYGNQFLFDLRWLPDGSGFLFSTLNSSREASNILRYDLKTRKATNITNFDDTFAGALSISPDGKWIVFEKADSARGENVGIWIVGIDGSGLRQIVKYGGSPAWSR